MRKLTQIHFSGHLMPLILALPFLGILLIVSQYNYLLFHTLAEFFAIAIAFGIFIVGWNTRAISRNPYLSHMGIAYLFIGFLDLLHTLLYKGMGILPTTPDVATQLWIATRYLVLITFIVFLYQSHRKSHWSESILPVITFNAVATILIILSIFQWDIFPTCYIEGTGLTPFKVTSEYILSSFFLLFAFLFSRMKDIAPQLRINMIFSALFTVASELSFTLYHDVYGVMNVTGHLFKILSYYHLYRAVIVITLQQPHRYLFESLIHEIESRDTFFSILSHDLRSPFNGLVGLTDTMVQLYDSLNDSQRKEYLQDLNSLSRSTLSLLENLLTWSQLQSGSTHPEISTVSLKESVDENIRLNSFQAEQKGISLKVEVPDLPLRTDRQMLATILRNLLSNAIKFTPAGGTIGLRAIEKDGTAHIIIEDSGTGMAREDLENLFDPVRTIKKTGTAGEKGTGLGLSIVKLFIEQCNGTLSLDSTPGAGTTFRFTMPLAKENHSP